MGCCDSHDLAGLYGLSGLNGLMGAIPQQLPAIGGGSPFQFGFNEGLLVPYQLDLEDMAKMLEDRALSYDTRVSWLAGYANRYITIEGYAVTTWQSGSDFGQAIYQALKDAGFDIDYASIQFRFEPMSGQPSGPQMVGTPYPNTGQPQIKPPQQPSKCAGMSPGNWIACQLGIESPLGGMATGTVGALLAVGLGTLVLVAVLKR
jgi:hypothetical protein